MSKKRELLIKLRDKTNMNQEELASKMGISQQTVSQLETGVRKPSLNLAKKYELFFDIPMEKLFPDLFHGLNITKRSIGKNPDQKSA
jgi:putative transcriptional regulator